MKKSFTILEIIIVILIIAIIITFALPKNNISKLKYAKEQIVLHLKYTRYIAMLDNQYTHDDEQWYKKLWRIKFERCDKKYGGVFYTIFKDTNKKGHANKNEALKDPLTGKLIYASNCNPNSLTKYQSNVLLKYHFAVETVDFSCNTTTNSIGQLMFDYNGDVFSNVSFNSDLIEKKLYDKCLIKLKDKLGNVQIINVETTGLIY